jgi:hypothetical protein
MAAIQAKNVAEKVPRFSWFVMLASVSALNADEAAAWDTPHERVEMNRVNHQEAYSFDGACTNMAAEYFSRLRHAEIGIHHHIAGAYLLRYAQESWREDNHRVSNGDQVNRITALALQRGKRAWTSRAIGSGTLNAADAKNFP